MKKEEMIYELKTMINDLDEHAKLMVKVVDGLRATINNDANITTLDDLRKALPSFTKARKSTERSKSIIKGRVMERIKG